MDVDTAYCTVPYRTSRTHRVLYKWGYNYEVNWQSSYEAPTVKIAERAVERGALPSQMPVFPAWSASTTEVTKAGLPRRTDLIRSEMPSSTVAVSLDDRPANLRRRITKTPTTRPVMMITPTTAPMTAGAESVVDGAAA